MVWAPTYDGAEFRRPAPSARRDPKTGAECEAGPEDRRRVRGGTRKPAPSARRDPKTGAECEAGPENRRRVRGGTRKPAPSARRDPKTGAEEGNRSYLRLRQTGRGCRPRSADWGSSPWPPSVAAS